MKKGKALFVFDLDFTLWDAAGTWCDCTYPPYKMDNGKVLDSEGSQIKLYPEVMEILQLILDQGKQIGIASRTNAPINARQLLNLFKILPFIHYEEIFPGSKIHHLKNIALNSGISFEDMVFFDDEMRNITDVSSLGVTSIFVQNGICKELVVEFLDKNL